jgi:putative endonuclease
VAKYFGVVVSFLLAATTMSHARQRLGKIGEDLACRELERRGYAIVARRYRLPGGELDIIARDGPTVVFVEVKARVGRRFGAAVDAVTGLKRHRMAQLALAYLTRYRLTECSCRFDVVSIQLENGCPTIEVFQNAFDAPG